MSSTKFVTIEGHRIAYDEQGEGTPIILLHGIPTNRQLWRNVSPKLAYNYRVIAPDLLNYGESDMPDNTDVSINAQSRILNKFMDALNIPSAHIAAHDIGGGIAQLMAVTYPSKVEKIILIDSVCFDSWPIPEFDPMLEPDAQQQTTVAELVKTLRGFMPQGVTDKSVMTEELINRYVEPWNSEKGKAAFFNNLRRLNKEYTQAIASELKTITNDTLIIWGEDDEFQKPKYAPLLLETIPDSKLIWIENSAHWVIDEQPDKVTDLINNFL